MREELFSELGLGDSFTTDPTGKLKKDLEEASQNLAQTLTPEMQANLRSELGIEDGTDLDAALKDPTSRQALEDKLKSTPQWSNIDLDTPAGENLFRALTGATGGLGDETTVE